MTAKRDLSLIRSMIEDGYTDEQISDQLSELHAEEADAREADQHHWSDEDELSMERAGNKWLCDETYERNDAGEYIHLC